MLQSTTQQNHGFTFIYCASKVFLNTLHDNIVDLKLSILIVHAADASLHAGEEHLPKTSVHQ